MAGWVVWHHLSLFLPPCRRTVALGGWHGGRRRSWAQRLCRKPSALSVALLPLQGASSIPAQEHLRRWSPGHRLWLQLWGWGRGQVKPWYQGQAEEKVCKFHFHPRVVIWIHEIIIHLYSYFRAIILHDDKASWWNISPCHMMIHYQIQNYWISYRQRWWNERNTWKPIMISKNR